MTGANDISATSLAIASILVVISLVLSYWQKLKLEKDIIVGIVRAIVQLVAVGFVLQAIFGFENPIFTTLVLAFMIGNAAYVSAKRGKGIKSSFMISLMAITAGTVITLAGLIVSGIISYTPSQIIPISGMIISNAMIALGLCYNKMLSDFKLRQDEVETKLALGAPPLLSSIGIIRSSIRTGVIPTIDSMKTLGVVSLPGMMSGLILAGTPPLEAIKYQIMVTFMLLSTTSIASFIACYRAYSSFFTERSQLRR